MTKTITSFSVHWFCTRTCDAGRHHVGLCPAHLFFFNFFRHAFSELAWPIAVKLCHMISIWMRFIMQVQKFGGSPPQKKMGGGAKTCKISTDFIQPPIWSRISPEGLKISKIGKLIFSRSIPPAFCEKGPLNFGPLITEISMWVWTH